MKQSYRRDRESKGAGEGRRSRETSLFEVDLARGMEKIKNVEQREWRKSEKTATLRRESTISLAHKE